MNTLSFTHTYHKAFEIVKEKPWFLIGITLITIMADSIFQFSFNLLTRYTSIILLLMMLATCLVAVWLFIGKTQILLSLVDHQPLPFRRLFSGAKLIRPMFSGLVTYQTISLLGGILFIIPGCVWAAKYSLLPILIADKGMDSREAIKKSALITDGYKWSLFLLGGALLTVSIIGVLPVKLTLALLRTAILNGPLFITIDCIGAAIFLSGYSVVLSISWLSFLIAYRQIEQEQEQGIV